MHCIPGFVRKSLCEQQARADYKGICYPDFHFRKGKCIFFRTHSTLINFYYQNVTLFTIWLYDRCCNLVAPQSKLLDYSFSTCKNSCSRAFTCLTSHRMGSCLLKLSFFRMIPVSKVKIFEKVVRKIPPHPHLPRRPCEGGGQH